MIQKIQQLCQEIASAHPLEQTEMNTYWTALNDLQMKSQIGISALDFRGEPDGNESIRITNQGHGNWNIGHWRINAGTPNQNYIFPENTLIHAGETIEIYTQPGSQHSFNSNRPIWNNHGDTGTLLNEVGETVSSWVFGKDAHACVVIANVHYDGEEFRTEGDEYVELQNISEHLVDLSRWQLKAMSNDHTFSFPPGAVLEPHNAVRVYTNRAPGAANEYSFNSPTAIWNNAGGQCLLLDDSGNEVATYTYG
ncbi:lamin tail domain-containing protein [Vibrio mangrovi]|nr:lamin tail domain-containing protein [Vibrio mangrovi]MDW6001869.1 lamin tail domain-containing protein [Vibrio mangrovi]